jgi:hypothetical protein
LHTTTRLSAENFNFPFIYLIFGPTILHCKSLKKNNNISLYGLFYGGPNIFASSRIFFIDMDENFIRSWQHWWSALRSRQFYIRMNTRCTIKIGIRLKILMWMWLKQYLWYSKSTFLKRTKLNAQVGIIFLSFWFVWLKLL